MNPWKKVHLMNSQREETKMTNLQKEQETKIEIIIQRLDCLLTAINKFMEAATEGEIIKCQTQFPRGESLVWKLREEYDLSKKLLQELLITPEETIIQKPFAPNFRVNKIIRSCFYCKFFKKITSVDSTKDALYQCSRFNVSKMQYPSGKGFVCDMHEFSSGSHEQEKDDKKAD